MSGKPTDGLAWADVAACTLPTAERPLRLAEFDDLFRSSLRSIDRTDETRARLVLAGDAGLADRTQALADAESSCCSFFRFGVTRTGADAVELEIEVPPEYAEVLAGLLDRARSVLEAQRSNHNRGIA